MSEQLASLHGKGVSIKRTTLWTNPSPSATFAAQSITLSDDMSNYDEIEIKGKSFYSGTAENLVMTTTSASLLAGNSVMYGTSADSHSVARVRDIYRYGADNKLYVTLCRYTGATTTNNTNAVPTEITGITIK